MESENEIKSLFHCLFRTSSIDFVVFCFIRPFGRPFHYSGNKRLLSDQSTWPESSLFEASENLPGLKPTAFAAYTTTTSNNEYHIYLVGRYLYLLHLNETQKRTSTYN